MSINVRVTYNVRDTEKNKRSRVLIENLIENQLQFFFQGFDQGEYS